jgi:hypothetical protein
MIHLIVLSLEGGNVFDVAILAVKSAMKSLRIPNVNTGVYKFGSASSDLALAEKSEHHESKMTSMLKGKDKGSFVEWELDNTGSSEFHGWKKLPVGVTLNLVSHFRRLFQN